jgi:hypothetical protein
LLQGEVDGTLMGQRAYATSLGELCTSHSNGQRHTSLFRFPLPPRVPSLPSAFAQVWVAVLWVVHSSHFTASACHGC